MHSVCQYQKRTIATMVLTNLCSLELIQMSRVSAPAHQDRWWERLLSHNGFHRARVRPSPLPTSHPSIRPQNFSCIPTSASGQCPATIQALILENSFIIAFECTILAIESYLVPGISSHCPTYYVSRYTVRGSRVRGCLVRETRHVKLHGGNCASFFR